MTKMNSRGFTLIELLVVITIIAVLAALVVLRLAESRVRSANVHAKSDISQLGKAVETWKTSNGDQLPNSGIVLSANVDDDPFTYNWVGTRITTNQDQSVGMYGGWDLFFDQLNQAFPIKMNRTAGRKYTYGYATNVGAGVPNMNLRVSTTYCLGSSMVNIGSVTDGGFYVMSGSSVTKTTSQHVVYANSMTPCS